MALRDFLPGNKTPTTPPAPPTKARGNSGRFHTNGFLQVEELNHDLIGFQGLRLFDQMYRGDGDVRRVVSMVCNPIAGGQWEVAPHGGDDASDLDKEIAEAFEWALFEFMRPTFTAHLAEALPLFVRSGFGPFEQTWARGTLAGKDLLVPKKLGLRLPRSVYRWMQDDDGDLTAIEQLVLGKGMVEIPRQDLVYYRVGAEGDNWEGTSMLRPAYKHWYIKDKVERYDAMAQEREAMGIPVVYPPQAATDGEKDAMEESLAKLRTGALGYLMMPGQAAEDMEKGAGGWRFKIEGFGGTSGSGGGGKGAGRDPQNTLNYHSGKIDAAFLTEFMNLGQQGVGARATADVQQNPFHDGVEALARIVKDEIRDSLTARFVALNYKDAEGLPTVQMAKADEGSMTDLASYASSLAGAGFLHPDDDLEDHLRERINLPPADPEARDARKQQEAEDRDLEVKGTKKALEAPVAPPGGGGKPKGPKTAARTFARQDRDLRWWEQHMDFDRLEQSIDEARARFEGACGSTVRAMAAEVAAAVVAGEEPDLTPPEALVQAIHDELAGLYTTGRDTVAAELARQRGHSTTYRFALTPQISDSLTARALLAATAIVRKLYEAAKRKKTQGRDDTRPHEVQAAAEAEGAAATRFEANMNAAAAVNEGRSDEADDRADEIKGAYYTSLLDANSCSDCETADDDVLRSLDDPVRLARKPPNRNCQGGDRCRCMEAFVIKDEAASSA